MCNASGVMVGWAIGTADCDGVISLEYFDEDGLTQGTSLPVGWKPCVQGETGPAWAPSHAAIPYAASVDIDFATDEFKTVTVSGDITFTGSNMAAPAEIVVRLVESGSASRALTFPAWTWVTIEPTTLAADSVGLLRLIAFGATAADVVASYEVAV